MVRKHYPAISTIEDFQEQVVLSGDHWRWVGGYRVGYSTTAHPVAVTPTGQTAAERLAWELTRGAVPPGKQIRPICGAVGFLCVNPAHLEAMEPARKARR